MEATKVCSKCKQIKSITDFHKDSCNPDGYSYQCKVCKLLYIKSNNYKKMLYDKTYYIENKERYKNLHDTYDRTHKQERKVSHNRYNKTRKENDPTFKLLSNIRSAVCRFLLGEKSNKTKVLLGATQEQFWMHLEKQFQTGMTRENYGSVWHVDHIIPLQFFKDNDLMDETNQKIAWHLGNLQPLFAAENISKSDSIPEKTNFKY